MEPFLPDAPDPLLKLLHPWAMARDAVVRTVPLQFLAELLVLLRNRPVPIVAAPLGDLLASPTQALTGGLLFDDPLPSLRLAPVVGASKGIDGARLVPRGGTRSPACHQAGLGRVDRPTVLPEALREPLQPLLRLLSVLTAHDDVVRTTRHERPTAQSWEHLLSAPEVEDIRERDVTEQR
jgi:hypothetical protein